MKKQGIKEVPAEECSDFTIPTVCLWTSSTDVLQENNLSTDKEKLNQIIEQYKEQSELLVKAEKQFSPTPFLLVLWGT